MTTVKMTKREKLETLKAILEGEVLVEDTNTEVLIAFCDREMELLAKKAESAKVAAAKRREKTDELYDAVLAVLTPDYAAIPDILALVDHPDATLGKVQSRLNKIFANGLAEKAQAKVEGDEGSKARKCVVYRLKVQD